MIQASELRIGNWIEEKVLGKIRVHEIMHASVWVLAITLTKERKTEETRYKISINDIEPIPLTPKILKKCGFVKHGERHMAIKHVIGFHIADMQCQIFDGECFSSLTYIESVKYLHQLQNLYFALTNKELNITL